MLDSLQSIKWDQSKLPQFSTIKVDEIVPTVKRIIETNKHVINELLENSIAILGKI